MTTLPNCTSGDLQPKWPYGGVPELLRSQAPGSDYVGMCASGSRRVRGGEARLVKKNLIDGTMYKSF